MFTRTLSHAYSTAVIVLVCTCSTVACANEPSEAQVAKKPYSINVTNGIRRPIGIRINRQRYEQVRYHYGSRTYRSSKPSFSVRIWVETKNGKKRKIFDGNVPYSKGNGHGHVKMTVYKKSRNTYGFRFQ